MSLLGFHRLAMRNGDGLSPAMERALFGPYVEHDTTAQNLIELYECGRDFPNASGPVPVGDATTANRHTIVAFEKPHADRRTTKETA